VSEAAIAAVLAPAPGVPFAELLFQSRKGPQLMVSMCKRAIWILAFASIHESCAQLCLVEIWTILELSQRVCKQAVGTQATVVLKMKDAQLGLAQPSGRLRTHYRCTVLLTVNRLT
jgi:hypothetical protein